MLINDLIDKYGVYFDVKATKNDIYKKIYDSDCYMAAYREFLTTNDHNITLISRDIVTNIRSKDALLFYIIDDIEYPLTDSARFIVSLSALNPIKIVIKNREKRDVTITYTIIILHSKIINKLYKTIVQDENFFYNCGKIHLNTNGNSSNSSNETV